MAMATFTVHLPPGEGAPEKIVFLRDGFSWAAFLFGPFWLAWRKAWIPAAAYTLALILIALLDWKADIGKDTMAWANIAIGVALGFEGTRLVAWSLARSGYEEKMVVIGDSLDEAEEVFFHHWRAATPSKPALERRD
jgi:hypothetical protein